MHSRITDVSVRGPVIDDQRYKGFHHYKMDPKLRVSIPPAWRPVTGEPLYLLCATQHDLPMVKVLTEEAYAEKVALIKGSDLTPKAKSDRLGTLAMLSKQANVNDQGKLLVPKEFSTKAGIAADAEVALAGRGNFFQIWSKSNFEQVFAIEAAQILEDDPLGIF